MTGNDPDALAIEMSGVGKKYRFFSLDNIDLKVPQGQIMGLIGPNGAGKSTTIRILMGLVHQDSGEVRVLGHRDARRAGGREVGHRLRVGRHAALRVDDAGLAHGLHPIHLSELGPSLRATPA